MTGFSNEVRTQLQERASVDGFVQCEVMAVCQGRAASLWQAHHRRPRAAGGSRRPETNQAANGLLVCGDDHRYIESHRETSLANGWLLRQNQNPCEVPVLRRRVWVLLDNSGGFERAKCVCGEVGSGGRFEPDLCVCVEGE